MYVFELNDEEIKIYNKKKNTLTIEKIPPMIISDNRVYDYLRLVNELNRIVYKDKIINNFFKVKIKILVFEDITKSEEYLLNNLFKTILNSEVEIIYVGKIFTGKYLFVSGNIIYTNENIIKHSEYILIGNSNDYAIIKNHLEKKYTIDILEYENSNTIIYEKI